MGTKLVWLLTRPQSFKSVTLFIQILSAFLISSLAFATVMLVRFFWGLADGYGGYRLLALALVGLLFVPLISLGASSAKLSVQSRNDRLSVLRLLGMAESRVRLIAVMEASLVQGLGITLSFFLSFLMPYLLTFIPIQGVAMSLKALQLPLMLSLLVYISLLMVGILSSQMGLGKLILTPLGIIQRSQSRQLSPFRLLAMMLLLAGGFVALRLASPSWGILGIMLILILVLVIVMGALNLVGPYLVYLFAQSRHRKTRSIHELIATRRNLENPKGTWRLVSSIAFTSFVLVPTGAMLGFLDAVRRGPSQLEESLVQLLIDTRTFLFLVVIISFMLVACQVAFTQLMELFEHKELYISLDRIGMTRKLMNKVRTHQALLPALVASLSSTFAAVILTFPLISVATTVSPIFILLIVLLIGVGNTLIVGTIRLTEPVLTYILEQSIREE